jgi:tRNA(Ile)-lysidine synthase
LLHFLRGSGLAGLAGMAPLSAGIARPLLDLTHADTLAYCTARGWRPREDSSNEDMRFLRNRVRRDLLPTLERYNPKLRETLARNAALIGEDERYLEVVTAALYEAAHIQRKEHAIRLPRHWLRDQPAPLRRRLLRRVVNDLAGDGAGLEARHVNQVEALLDTGRTGKSLNLPGGLRAVLEYETLTITRAHVKGQRASTGREYQLAPPGCVEAPEISWRVRAWYVESLPGLEPGASPDVPPIGQLGTPADVGRAESRVYLDADVAGSDLLVRTWRPGDRFRPLGMKREKKLQDYFADAKVPRALRGRIPLVFNSRHLLWVGGQRIDDRARLTPGTRRVLALQLEPPQAPAAESSPPSSVEPARKGKRAP